jgi:hypothetical protein
MSVVCAASLLNCVEHILEVPPSLDKDVDVYIMNGNLLGLGFNITL